MTRTLAAAAVTLVAVAACGTETKPDEPVAYPGDDTAEFFFEFVLTLEAIAEGDPEAKTYTCRFVEQDGARSVAADFEAEYSPDMAAGLPYDLDGATDAFEAWCIP